MDIILTEEQRQNVVKYLRNLLAVFDSGQPVTNSQEEKKPQVDPLTLNWDTFQGWSDKGFRIIKGEKSTRIDGICMFNENQVRGSQPTYKAAQPELPNDGVGLQPEDWDDVPF